MDVGMREVDLFLPLFFFFVGNQVKYGCGGRTGKGEEDRREVKCIK